MTFEEITAAPFHIPYYKEILELVKKFNLNFGNVIHDYEHVYFNIAEEDHSKTIELLQDYYTNKYSKEKTDDQL